MPLLADVIKRILPVAYLQLKTSTGRLFRDEVERLALRKTGAVVAAGPFKGMRYINRANCSTLAPKLLGTYEIELQHIVATIIDRGYAELVDIGAAEGYYAVGFALRMPYARVRAFDIDPDARTNLQALIALNGVGDRVTVHGECSFETLNGFAQGRTLVVCDIEGSERMLLDPTKAPALSGLDLLVEIHDGPHSTSIHDLLQDRFGASHAIRYLRHEVRRPEQAAHAPWLGHDLNRMTAMDEQRTFGIEWGHFTTLSR